MRTIRQDLADLFKGLKPYHGLCFDVRLERDGIVVRCNGNESVRLVRVKKNQYRLDYDASPQHAQTTFEKGTILGTKEDMDAIFVQAGDAQLPRVLATYAGTYAPVRTAFEQVIGIFIEKHAN